MCTPLWRKTMAVYHFLASALSINLSWLFYAGEMQKLKMATYFFLTRGLDLHKKAKLLLYTTTNSAQTPTYVVEVIHSFTHCRWMYTNTARQEYATQTKVCTLCTQLQTDATDISWFVDCQNSRALLGNDF